ncbi:MAG: ATP-dependent zinc protease [Hyphomicrobiales bacterium]|nr:MAG: ATP-dependent zinc protease [Hyphomicrobiales bacterium]
MSKKHKWPPIIIGWREWIGLPDLDGACIKAKIDSGARTSSVHAWNIRTRRGPDGWQATFDLHPNQDDNSHVLTVTAPIIGMREIRSSSGHVQERIVIRTRLQLAERVWPIEMTLSRRDEMGFRMLLGRSAMRGGHVLVDPSRSFLAGNRPRKKHE